jgi:large subunit ribosomal protein L10
MAVSRQVKQNVLAMLDKGLTNAQSVVFVSFDKLTVAESNSLRRTLESQGISYKVVKKTLLRKALETVSVAGTLPPLDGNLAIAWSETDAAAAPREVYTFAQDGHKDQIKLIGGIFEGSYRDAQGINEIATIPSMQVLRGMFVNLINSPRQRFAVVLSEYAKR